MGEFFGIIGTGWNLLVGVMINILVLLYSYLFNSFGLTVVAFTIIVRMSMFQLTVKQSRSLKKMSGLQPKLKEIQAKYKNDRQRISQETMRMYKEAGVNPLGCLGPMFIQMPIWIALYQSILRVLPSTPDSLVGLSGHLYSWLPRVHEVVPLESSFLWLDLAFPDTTPILPVLVGGSMFVMQKMTTMPTVDPRQKSTNQMMLWMMPLMFGFFTTTFPSGLALYWVISNVVGVVIQGFVTGWEPLASLNPMRRSSKPSEAPALVPPEEETVADERDSDHSQDDRRGNRNRPKGARRRSRRGRNRRR